MIHPRQELRHAVAVVGCCIALASSVSAWAGPPSNAIQQTHEAMVRVLHDPALADPAQAGERQQQLVLLIAQRFSCREMARHILGSYWSLLEEEEQAEFVRLFRLLLLKTYAWHIDRYVDQRIEYLEERFVNGRAVVQTKLTTAHHEARVEFWLSDRLSDWHVYDVVVDGMSLIDNYRGQFRRVIRLTSYANLVDQMQQKVCPPGCAEQVPVPTAGQ